MKKERIQAFTCICHFSDFGNMVSLVMADTPPLKWFNSAALKIHGFNYPECGVIKPIEFNRFLK